MAEWEGDIWGRYWHYFASVVQFSCGGAVKAGEKSGHEEVIVEFHYRVVLK
jgi:hypothetical protein